MIRILLLVILTTQALLAKPPGIDPDKKLTPGLVAPVTQAEVLRAGDTVDARHVTDQTKWEVPVRCKPARGVFDHAQLPALPRQDDIDPFIPLEPGGANDLAPTGRMWAASIHLSCVRVTVSVICRAQDS